VSSTAELSGAKPVRGTDEVLKPPGLVEKFQRIKEGRVLNLGYYYRIYLPGQKARERMEAAEEAKRAAAEATAGGESQPA